MSNEVYYYIIEIPARLSNIGGTAFVVQADVVDWGFIQLRDLTEDKLVEIPQEIKELNVCHQTGRKKSLPDTITFKVNGSNDWLQFLYENRSIEYQNRKKARDSLRQVEYCGEFVLN